MDKYLLKTAQDVFDILISWKFANVLPTQDRIHGFNDIKYTLNCCQENFFKYGHPLPNWPAAFTNLAIQMLSLIYSVDLEWNMRSFAELLLSKHKVYTAAPLRRWRELGVLIRIDSKFERAYQIFHNPELNPEEHKESLEQNLSDTLGYCVLGYLLNKESKESKASERSMENN